MFTDGNDFFKHLYTCTTKLLEGSVHIFHLITVSTAPIFDLTFQKLLLISQSNLVLVECFKVCLLNERFKNCGWFCGEINFADNVDGNYFSRMTRGKT